MKQGDGDEDAFRQLRTQDDGTFLARGDIPLNAVTLYDRSLLHEAIASGKLRAARGLISLGIDVDHQDSNGETPLHFAATFAAFDIAALLLDRGANPNIADRYGNEPLWTAAMNATDDFRLVRLLMERGARPEHKNKAGRSPLDFARQSDNKALWLACGGREDGFEAV